MTMPTNQCPWRACRQQQEFIFCFIVAGKFPHRVRKPEIITAFYIARQPLGADTVINPPHGQGDIFTHAWRGGNGVSTQRFR